MHRLAVSLVVLRATTVVAQPPEGGTSGDGHTELAKATQNPVSDLVSIPLQFNFNSGGALADQSLLNLNVQPVLPIQVTPGWAAITRVIVPLFDTPTADGDRERGLGDVQAEVLLSPRTTSSLVWGIGPLVSLPTATLEDSSTGSWAVGPAAVVVLTKGRWVVGALATQAWTFADYGDDRDVNQFLVQPFVNYNLGAGWALTTAPQITASWDAADEWTVPVGGGLSWTTRIGEQPMSLGAQYYRNVVTPDIGAENQLRFVVSFLFPKERPSSGQVAQRSPRDDGAP